MDYSGRGKSNNNPSVNEVQKNSQASCAIGNINVKSIAGNCRGKKCSAGKKRSATFTDVDVHLQKCKSHRKLNKLAGITIKNIST